MSFKIIILAAGLLSLNSACTKKGCRDSSAANYDPSAKKESGNCSYEGNAVFWYDASTKSYLDVYGITSLTYVIGNANIGSFPTNVSWESVPECGIEGSIGRTFSYSSNEPQVFDYSVVDQNGVERWSGSGTVYSGECNSFQLVW